MRNGVSLDSDVKGGEIGVLSPKHSQTMRNFEDFLDIPKNFDSCKIYFKF